MATADKLDQARQAERDLAAKLKELRRFTRKSEVELYRDDKTRAAEYAQRVRTAATDVGPTKAVADVERRARCRGSLRAFCETYFAPAFSLAWSPAHLRAIDRIEQAVWHGELFAFAMPRGSGKTTVARVGSMWAVLNGWRRYVFVVGATADSAEKILDGCKQDVAYNLLLRADYPETVDIAAALENNGRLCKGQHQGGTPTESKWESGVLKLPTAAAPPNWPDRQQCGFGAVIAAGGITGNIRGQFTTQMDGSVIRPDLVIVDDPQTTESAFSESQTRRRIALLNGDILGLAGPDQKIAGFAPCTVIRQRDMADQLLDRTISPDWHGERTKMLDAMPSRMDLWDQYAILRADSMRNDGRGEPATEFYRENREAMDAGAKPTWPERKHAEELSAVQHAMNLYFRDQASFWAEYQNEPLATAQDSLLDPNAIAAKVSGYPRGTVPPESHFLTAFIDVQQDLLYWLVAAWQTDFTGSVVAYGAYPDQRTPNFRLANARRKLSDVYPDKPFEAYLVAGLDACVAEIVGNAWQTPDRNPVELRRILIDANWGRSTDHVYDVCRQSPHKSLLMPSHGRSVTAKNKPLSEYTRRPGDQVGRHWRITTMPQRQQRACMFDANRWKTFLAERLTSPRGLAGCVNLHEATPAYHDTIASHLCAEYAIKVSANGRTVEEWSLKPDRPDNHWLDCLVGCCVAASMCGARLASEMQEAPRKKKRGSGVAYL